MAFRLPNSLQDALPYSLRSQKTRDSLCRNNRCARARDELAVAAVWK